MTDSPTPPTVPAAAVLGDAATTIDDLREQLEQAHVDLQRMKWMRDHARRYASRKEAEAATADARADAKEARIARLDAARRQLELDLVDANARADAVRPADPVVLLRQAAEHRRLIAKTLTDVDTAKGLTGTGEGSADTIDALHLQADTLDTVVAILLGNTGPLYDWLPSHQWTAAMRSAIGHSAAAEPGS